MVFVSPDAIAVVWSPVEGTLNVKVSRTVFKLLPGVVLGWKCKQLWILRK